MILNDTLLKSILAMKRDNKTWSDIAEAINEDLSLTLTGEAVRKRVQRFRKSFPIRYKIIKWSMIFHR